MYVIREVLNCKPGKVKPLLEKFKTLSSFVQDTGHAPLRFMTDVTGEAFWTLVAEATVESVDEFFALERQLMANDVLRKTMADYHELVESGRREIYRMET
jgi:hypothetical protein